jgi:hypothetical protein
MKKKLHPFILVATHEEPLPTELQSGQVTSMIQFLQKLIQEKPKVGLQTS